MELWKHYTINNTTSFSEIPVTDAGVTPDDWDACVTDGIVDPEDEEVSVLRLAEDWNGHSAGRLFVCGLNVEGHSFWVYIGARVNPNYKPAESAA